MSEFSAKDVESTARRVGWQVSTERVAQIAATAGPRIEAFGRIRARLTFEDEAAGFAAALIDTRQPAESKA